MAFVFRQPSALDMSQIAPPPGGALGQPVDLSQIIAQAAQAAGQGGPAPDPATQAPQQAQPVPQAPQAAPQPPPEPPDNGFRPSALDTIFDVLTGKSPLDSVAHQREAYYAKARNAILMAALQTSSPERQLAMLLNPAEEGKALSTRDQDMPLTGGQTRGTATGQRPFTATTYGLDPVSGKPFAIGPQIAGGFQTSSQALPGKMTIDPTTGAVMSDRAGPTGQSVGIPVKTAPGESLHAFVGGVNGAPSSVDGSNGGALAYPFGAPKPAAVQSGAGVPALAAITQNGRFNPSAFIQSFVLPHEGGLNPHDMNGAPTKFGINQAANPGVDVPNLTPAQASQIYMQKYLPISGAANLPPALGAVHLDTSIINPAAAQHFLQQSGGDPSRYMDLRDAWMQSMIQHNPAAAPYARAWAQRNADLRGIIDQGAPQAAAGLPGTGGRPLVQGGEPRILDPSDPHNAAAYKGLPAGTILQQAPDGAKSVLHEPEYDPRAKNTIRDHVLSSEAYNQAKASMSAYQAMVGNAGKMTGVSAYSMLDTFARAINPGAVARPTVIQTIEANLGLPAQLVGGLESKFGQGNLPPQIRQQIIDAVVPFAQAHWDQAKMLNDANEALAVKHKFDPADVTAPLESRPERVVVSVPGDPKLRQRQTLYETPKGPLRWTGTGWVKPQ